MSEAILMDARTMHNTEVLKGALAITKKMKPVTYDVMDGFASRRDIGIVGDTIGEIPSAVEVDGIGFKYVDLIKLVPVLVGAVQELTKKVEALEKKGSVKKTEE